MTTFLRLLADKDKAGSLSACCTALRAGSSDSRLFTVEPELFRTIPGAPFAYWVSEAVREIFAQFPPFESHGRAARVGLQTSDDSRFVRVWWECYEGSDSWWGFAKGGAFSPYYSDVYLVVNWARNGKVMKAWADPLYGNSGWSRIIKSTEYYTRIGITWSSRASGLSFRVLPEGCVFAHKGPSAFVATNDPGELMALCAIVNSRAFGLLVSLQLARTELAQSFEVGLIQQTPIPNLDVEHQAKLAKSAARAWLLKRILDSTDETSHAFVLPWALRSRLGDYDTPNIETELGRLRARARTTESEE